MASSYSPLLRLELMATGEKNGLWGNVTNTNLSTILEQAIAGTVNISVTGASSPITLTVANGASDQSRTAILLITGTNASPVSIVAPATSKLYFVKNSSNQPITIKTSTSTGVAIAVGDSRFVFYDTVASDFALGPSSTVTGTVTSVAFSGGTTGLTVSGSPITSSGTITIGGTLAITNGGTGATSRANAINSLLPSQSGQAGKVLYTDGADASWVAVGGGTVSSVAVTTALSGITITGSPITAAGTIAITGTLGIGSGGTGQTTANAGFNALAPLQTSNSGKFLTTNGTDTSWATAITSVSGGSTGIVFTGSPTLTMSGALAVANGGTGATNASTAINNLLPGQSGNSGKVLSTDGTNVSWITQSGGGTGTVTSVAFNPGTTGLSVTGSPITTSGTINLSGTLSVANGGTGATTTTGAINNLLPSQSGNAGKFLATNGANVAWAPVVTDITFGTTGLTPSTSTAGVISVGGTLAITSGGTGATTATNARTNLGLGTLATQNSVNLGTQVTGTLAVSSLSTGSAGQVLTMSGGTPTWAAAASAGGGFSNLVVFTTSGTWTVPSGVTKAKVTVVGGGGGGSAGSSGSQTGGAGGGGGAAIKIFTGLSGGGTLTVTVGNGGAAGTGTAAGSSGTSSSIVGPSTVSATGGAGGTGRANRGGAGGIGSGGDLNIGGGGGGGGINFGSSGGGPNGGSSILGGGGNGGGNGRAYGGGGGGGNAESPTAAGNGADGVVIIEY